MAHCIDFVTISDEDGNPLACWGIRQLLYVIKNMFSQVKAGIKYLLSFTKTDWQLSDYPVRFRRQKPNLDMCSGNRLKLPAWYAQVINCWQLSGLGETKKEAYADLRANFSKLKENGGNLPRPWTGLPIEFSASDEVDKHVLIAANFFEKILDIDYRECFILDESSLWDFHTEESNDVLNRKIIETYGVDISDIESGNLVQIFNRISGYWVWDSQEA